MNIVSRKYIAEPRYGSDYSLIRKFLLSENNINYSFGRWDWMISHSYLNQEELSKIGLWFHNEDLVGIATFDTMIDGNCFFVLKKDFEFLYKKMIIHAENDLSNNGKTWLLIDDCNAYFQKVALEMGYIPTQSKDYDAIFDITSDSVKYWLPEGFTVTSMKDTYDLYQYGRVLWKGFNHESNGEGEYQPTDEKIEIFRKEFERPNVNLELKVAVVASDGSFVSYCGMWQDSETKNVLVEPVATDPAYRKMGLGRAAVLEAIRRCSLLGAEKALVGSSQQFYYNIGFRPCKTSTFWEKSEKSSM